MQNDKPKVSVLEASQKILMDMKNSGNVSESIVINPAEAIGSVETTLDISRYKITNDYINSILESTGIAKEEKKEVSEVIEEEVINDQDDKGSDLASIEAKLENLVKVLGSILMEVKTVVTEMTSVGMLGVGPSKSSKKKNGSIKSNKGNKGNVC